MSKIWLTSDSTADLPDELYKEYDIEFVSSGITIGDNFYLDRVDITPEDIFHAVERLNIYPKTSAGLEEDFRKIFTTKAKGNDHVLHLSLSGELSAANSNARRATDGNPNVHVLDTRSISGGVGLACVIAGELIKQKLPIEKIVEEISSIIPRIQCHFVLDNLKYLHKGGRVSGLKLMGANLLGIRPSMKLENGKIVPGKKFKGKFESATKDFTENLLGSFPNADKTVAVVINTDAPQAIWDETCKRLKDAGFARVIPARAGCGIVPHGGRCAIGIAFVDGLD